MRVSASLSVDGEKLPDPRGRTVRAVGAWSETDDDPEEVWEELTLAQREWVEELLVKLRADAQVLRGPKLTAEVDRMLRGVRVSGRSGNRKDPRPFGLDLRRGEE